MSKPDFGRVVGVIGKPYGIKGYVFINLFTDYPNIFKKNESFFIDNSDEKFDEKVEKVVEKVLVLQDKKEIYFKNNKSRTIFKFYNIDTRSDAEKLRGLVLYRKISNQPKLKKNVYWIDELINCNVYTPEGILYGKVVDVENIPSNDNLILKKPDKSIEYIPMIEDYIENIEIDKKKIYLKKIPEYF